MSLFFTLLTIVLVVDCLILTLLILMQLPKKEAGLGQAFGSSATDALFGAGSGNVLTKTTKYAAGLFFVLAIVLSILSPRLNEEKVRQRKFLEGASSRAPKSTIVPPTTPLPNTNLLSPTTPLLSASNAAATTVIPPATNK